MQSPYARMSIPGPRPQANNFALLLFNKSTQELTAVAQLCSVPAPSLTLNTKLQCLKIVIYVDGYPRAASSREDG